MRHTCTHSWLEWSCFTQNSSAHCSCPRNHAVWKTYPRPVAAQQPLGTLHLLALFNQWRFFAATCIIGNLIWCKHMKVVKATQADSSSVQSVIRSARLRTASTYVVFDAVGLLGTDDRARPHAAAARRAARRPLFGNPPARTKRVRHIVLWASGPTTSTHLGGHMCVLHCTTAGSGRVATLHSESSTSLPVTRLRQTGRDIL